MTIDPAILSLGRPLVLARAVNGAGPVRAEVFRVDEQGMSRPPSPETGNVASGSSARSLWRAVERRDRAQDGRFVFGVVTTGVYCRPSCAARRPRRENVRFFATAIAAERDGFRACLRCRPHERPDDTRVALVRQICEHIRLGSDGSRPLGLAALARRSGYSAAHLTRLFREVLGLTPRQFAEACRIEALKRHLRGTDSITAAIYEAGFGSSSRVYERADQRLGMTPGAYQQGGRGLEISYAGMPSPLGRLLVAATDRGICYVQFGATSEELLAALRREYPGARLSPAEPSSGTQLGRWAQALRAHLDGRRPHADLPLDLRTTAFRFRVYRYLASIPAGEVRSYTEVARAIGRPRAVRAVASACASNTVAVLIPCHRVIRSNGDLAGYRWGVERKRKLLEQEHARAKA